MFPKVFEDNIKGHSLLSHSGVSFKTKKSKTQIVALFKKMGIAGFLKEDNVPTYNSSRYSYDTLPDGKKPYNDERIIGVVNWHTAVQCCSWTKDSTRWYLFPLKPRDFQSVGITIDDALYYIKTLNDLNVGFKYLYLGLEMAGDNSHEIGLYNKCHWFAVPATEFTDKRRVPCTITYMHWIFLRMLVNTFKNQGINKPETLPYFNFPRVLMLLKDDMGLNPWKAFLYAHAAVAWYYYYSMTHAHACITDVTQKTIVPDLGITKKDFKTVWYAGTSGTMNNTFCSVNNNSLAAAGYKIVLEGKHDVLVSIPLFVSKQYPQFIEYMDGIYHPSIAKKAKKVQNDISKAKLITRGKKKATQPASKREVKANS